MILTDQDNHDTLENIVLKDFNKKNIWDDTWMTPEKERDNGSSPRETSSEQGMASESD